MSITTPLLQDINMIGILLLLVVNAFYLMHLRKVKRERALTIRESLLVVVAQAGYLLWAGSHLLEMIST
ncbi:hypothetical protein J2W91_004125 [Paenibacillus amylolyticus]|uniref:Uncharacterized protein n=1 Tax=Paenibacillus amylolyticus TaxID=1451 RepID=A0AAP5H6H0_PAEAM|nr:hypothetical protein [Paenibacillus amylolyticus]MDR6725623.1 hypothetical protein [Paenibacillus amylolyticus]